MGFPGRIITCLLVVILIFIFPLQYISQLISESIDAMVDERTRQLSNKIRQEGYLDVGMYDEYMAYLHASGERYYIDIQDIRPVKGECLNSYPNSYERVSYKNLKTQIPHNHNDDSYTENNRLTDISVMPNEQTIQRYAWPSLTVMSHYDDGTSLILNPSQYIITGFDPSKTGLQKVTIAYTEKEITKSTSVDIRVGLLQRTCPRCQESYDLSNDDTDPGCPYCRNLIVGIELSNNYLELTQGDNLSIDVIGIYNDGSKKLISEWTSNYDSLRLGLQIVTIEYEGYTADISVWVNELMIDCPICHTEYPKSEVNCPYCKDQIVKLTVSEKKLTVIQHEPISLTVIAHFADGSSRQIDDWNIDISSAIPGKFIARVTYKGVSELIELNVLSIDTVECPICNRIYEMSTNIKGCPVCSERLVGIEAYHTSGSNLVQLGSRPDIGLVLIYLDEHRELALEGYSIENYNPYELGVQEVRIVYKEFIATIEVEVVDMLDTITCPYGHVYYKDEGEIESGCPFCHRYEDNNKLVYFDITYNNEILEKVYSTGAYYFQKGNYITIKVIKKNQSFLYQVQTKFFASSTLGRKKEYVYGGEVG